MIRHLGRIVLALIVAAGMAAPGHAAEKRVALVIGNSGYHHTAKLPNPRNDAADIAAALRTKGFEVIEGHDLDKSALDRSVREFARALTGAHVSLLFYAGHGLQVDGQNYLVPVDARLDDSTGLDFELVRVDLVQRTMERATRTSLLFLDACRDNPLARSLARSLGTRSAAVGKGLAQIESGEGTLISFSTQPGNVALDGGGRNSPYAAALIKQLRATTGDDLSGMLIAVRNDVMQETARRQVPWEHSALTARFYFTPPTVGARGTDAAPTGTARRFDGVWELAEGRGGDHCAVRQWGKDLGGPTLTLRIVDGVVTAPKHVSGRVSETGDLRFTIRGHADPSVTVEHAVRLGETAGNGTYEVRGGRCRGVTSFKRVVG